MDDYAIRQALKEMLRNRHENDGSIIVEEFSVLEGDARADMAVINGSLNGFEIKSDRDTLTRLPNQQVIYSQLFDTVTLVVGEKLFTKAREEIPEWWGIIVATSANGRVCLTEVRTAKTNTCVEAMSVLRLIWKAEAIDILKSMGREDNHRVMPREQLWRTIAELLPVDEVKRRVREVIKSREGWRVGQSPFRRGDSPRSSAKSQHSQKNLRWLLSRKSPRLPN